METLFQEALYEVKEKVCGSPQLGHTINANYRISDC